MRDWFLIPVLAIIFVFTYFAVNRFRVLGQIRHQKKRQNPNKKCRIRIGAENHALLNRITPALEYCEEALPHVEFSTNCENHHFLFRRLKEEALDIALIAEEHKEAIPSEFLFIPIPNHPGTSGGGKAASHPETEVDSGGTDHTEDSLKCCAKDSLECRTEDSREGCTKDSLEDQQKILPAKEENFSGFVVWNSLRESSERDRIISMIENEYCTLQCGYCDYQ